MKRSSFLLILKIIYFFRTVLIVVLNIIFTIPFFKPHIWSIRKNFEKKNLDKNSNDDINRSFKRDGESAWVCVSVSSEGELEQAFYFILHQLKSKRKVEIIYSSPSVEHKMIKLKERFPKRLRTLRLPLLSLGINAQFSPKWHEWVTAKYLIFCRYDFYPELLLLRPQMEKMELFSASLLNKNLKGLSKFYFTNIFKLFDRLYLASPQEEQRFKSLDLTMPMINLEWRVLSINERLDNRDYELNQKLGVFFEDINIIYENHNNNFIFASVWPHEWNVIREIIKFRGGGRSYIFPHDTGNDTIEFFKQKCEQLQRPYLIIGSEIGDVAISNAQMRVPGLVVIFKVKGILLECLPTSEICYVGGGFGRSIHSVLEPFLAELKVIVGPKVHRSSEFELFKSVDPDTICVIKAQEAQEASGIHETLRLLEKLLVNKEKRNKFKKDTVAKAFSLLEKI